MKAQLNFDLEEPYEEELFRRYMSATDLCSSICQIRNMFKNEWRNIENEVKKGEHKGTLLDRMEKEFYEILDDHNINLEKIYS